MEALPFWGQCWHLNHEANAALKSKAKTMAEVDFLNAHNTMQLVQKLVHEDLEKSGDDPGFILF